MAGNITISTYELPPTEYYFGRAIETSRKPLIEPTHQQNHEATPGALAENNDVSIWPSLDFCKALYAYHTPFVQSSRRLTKIFALALELPENYFDEFAKRPEAGMRILHYSQQQHSIDDQNGIDAYTDVECFAIVTQDDSGGLEVLNKSGQWIKAKLVPGAFVVNIADCFMKPANDILRVHGA